MPAPAPDLATSTAPTHKSVPTGLGRSSLAERMAKFGGEKFGGEKFGGENVGGEK